MAKQTVNGPDQLRRRWTGQERVAGVSATLGSAFAVELACLAGFNYVIVDQQHGLSHAGDVFAMLAGIQASTCHPIVRVSANQPEHIGRALDAGAHGVIVPLINSAAEAARAVEACRYPPSGSRSFGPVRAGALWAAGMSPTEVNAQTLCLPMIESHAALEVADDIAATPGVDALYVGPADLALSLGESMSATMHSDKLTEALSHVIGAGHAHQVPVGVHATEAALAHNLFDLGFDFVTLSTDTALLRSAFSQTLQAVSPDQGVGR